MDLDPVTGPERLRVPGMPVGAATAITVADALDAIVGGQLSGSAAEDEAEDRHLIEGQRSVAGVANLGPLADDGMIREGLDMPG